MFGNDQLVAKTTRRLGFGFGFLFFVVLVPCSAMTSLWQRPQEGLASVSVSFFFCLCTMFSNDQLVAKTTRRLGFGFGFLFFCFFCAMFSNDQLVAKTTRRLGFG